MNDDWRERLEKEFKDMFSLVEIYAGVNERENLKQFISKEIERVREDILARLDGIKKGYEGGVSVLDSNKDYLTAIHNEAIDKVRQIIQHPKGE